MLFTGNVYETAYLALFAHASDGLQDLATWLETAPDDVPEHARAAQAKLLCWETPSPAEAAAWYMYLLELHERTHWARIVHGQAALDLHAAHPGRVLLCSHDRPELPGRVLTRAEAVELCKAEPQLVWASMSTDDDEDLDDHKAPDPWAPTSASVH